MDTNPYEPRAIAGKPDRIGLMVAEVESLVAVGVTVTKACQKIGIPRVTYNVRKRASKDTKNPPAHDSAGVAVSTHRDREQDTP